MEAIGARGRTESFVLRSQLLPSAWHASLGNGVIAEVVIDRMAYKSCTMYIEGEEPMLK